jgi:hypothetical protein
MLKRSISAQKAIPTPTNALTLPEEPYQATWVDSSPFRTSCIVFAQTTEALDASIINPFVAEQCKHRINADPAALYLAQCGLGGPVPEGLWYHPALDYSFDSQNLGKLPAMVAVMRGPNGRPRELLYTFLTPDGRLAAVPHPRILTHISLQLRPAFLALHAPRDGVLGIALSVEAAQAAFLDYGVPTVAAITYRNLASFTPPKEVRRLIIFANNDLGALDSALVLSAKAMAAGLTVKVMRLPQSIPNWCALRAKRQAKITVKGRPTNVFLRRTDPLTTGQAALFAPSTQPSLAALMGVRHGL